MTQINELIICYLCSQPIVADSSQDHVPPRQFYAKTIRQLHSPNLYTLPAHASCNKSYQFDEDYFVNTLAPFAVESYSGNELLKGIKAKYETGANVGLVQKVLNEFERRPSDIILPPGLVAKRIEGERVKRVLWKIIRGLYYRENNLKLPENSSVLIKIFPPDEPPPLLFQQALGDLDSRGDYPSVFDYKYYKDPTESALEHWGFLLWDKLIITALFEPIAISDN